MQWCIIGCGNMGLIYTRYFTQQQIIKQEDLLLIEKNESRRQELSRQDILTSESLEGKEIQDIRLLLIAVKPQDFEETAKQLAGKLNKECLVISIMAGIRIASIRQQLQADAVVRAMPNAPALYGEGMTVYCSSGSTSEQQRQLAAAVLSVTGKTIETKEEEQLNAVTAVSGSGPAYFFYLAQHMINEAKALGIDEETAELLVKQTLLGAGVMLDRSGKSNTELMKTVASKGGTTEAALNAFEERQLPAAIAEGLQRAARRAFELAK